MNFHTKRNASDWARRVEDEMIRGVYVDRAAAERLTLQAELTRYLADVITLKSASTQVTPALRGRLVGIYLGRTRPLCAS